MFKIISGALDALMDEIDVSSADCGCGCNANDNTCVDKNGEKRMGSSLKREKL